MISYLKKLTIRDQFIGLTPALIIFLLSIWTFANGGQTGVQPRERIFDLYTKLIPREAVNSHLDRYAIIDIDKQSLERIAPWPWPRTALANLIASAEEAGAKSVVLTVPVNGQDPLSPEAVGQYWFAPSFIDKSSKDISALSAKVRALPSTDVSLARALTRIPTAITSLSPSSPVEIEALPFSKTQQSLKFPSPPAQIALYAATKPGEISTIVAASAKKFAPIILKDNDGIVRRAPLFFIEHGEMVPSASLAPLMYSSDAPSSEIELYTAASILFSGGNPLKTINIKDETLDLDPTGSLIFYPPASNNIEIIPAWRILGGSKIWSNLLKDKVVYINQSIDTVNAVQTASGSLSASAFHILILDQLLSGQSLKRIFWMPLIEALAAFSFGLVVVALCLLGKIRIGLGLAGALCILTLATSWLLFSTRGILFDPIAPVITITLGLIALLLSQMAFLFFGGDKARLHFHGAFPTATLSSLQRDRNANLLDGQSRQITVISAALTFPDAQKVLLPQRPDEYVKFIAQANHVMRQSIQSLGGVVDYAESGTILGYWNAPAKSENHVEQACTCALQLIEDISSITADVQSAQFARVSRGQKAGGARFEIEQARLEVGIVSEPAIAGPVGTAPFNRYSVIGQSIAYARLLRQRSKLYGPAIICDEAIYRELRHRLAFLDLDTINISGNIAPRSIYGLVGNPFLKASRGFREISELQQSLTDSWKNRQSKETLEALEKLKKSPGTHKAFIELYDYRLNKLKNKASPELQKKFHWDNDLPIEL